jgi:hypothetical protein
MPRKRQPFRSNRLGTHAWCRRCQHVYPTEKLIIAFDGECPNPDCDGGLLDAQPWSEVRTQSDRYPIQPPDGGHYPAEGQGSAREG